MAADRQIVGCEHPKMAVVASKGQDSGAVFFKAADDGTLITSPSTAIRYVVTTGADAPELSFMSEARS